MIPENILRCMSKDQKKKLGREGMTTEEGQAKLEAKSERELHGQISAMLRLRGIWFIHSRMDKRPTVSVGTVDFAFAVHGVPIGVEVKYGDGKLSLEQAQTHEAMKNNGWRVFICRDMHHFKAILDSY